jgi:hypothetical protein
MTAPVTPTTTIDATPNTTPTSVRRPREWTAKGRLVKEKRNNRAPLSRGKIRRAEGQLKHYCPFCPPASLGASVEEVVPVFVELEVAVPRLMPASR